MADAARYHGEPEALARDLREGDTGAFSAARTLLTGDHAWTRAQTARMLADAPASRLLPELQAALAVADPHPAWWAVPVHRFERVREAAADPVCLFALSAMRTQLSCPGLPGPEALLSLLLLLDHESSALRADLLPRFWECAEAEVVLEAAARASQWGIGVPDSARRTLRSVPPPRADEAWILLAELEEPGALDVLVSIALRRGPWTFAALDVLEEKGEHRHAEQLRPLWSRSLLASYHAPRAAACAARLGHEEARERLLRFARSRRAHIRNVALGELLRIGDAHEVRSFLPELAALSADELLSMLHTLITRSEEEMRALARVIIDAHPDPALARRLRQVTDSSGEAQSGKDGMDDIPTSAAQASFKP